MPREHASHGRAPRQPEQKRDILPAQKPVTDEEEPASPPSKIRVFLKRVGTLLLLCLALALAYVLLVMMEPSEPEPQAAAAEEEVIHVPMAAIEETGNAGLAIAAPNFGKPVLALYGDLLPLQKVTVADTAFRGSYARRATLVYVFEDGQQVRLESLRPTMAAELLKTAESRLSMGSRYALAGLDAVRMDTGEMICVFAKSGEAVYAVTCPASHAADLSALLRQTQLLEP